MPRALTLQKVDGKPGKVYYPLQVKQVQKPTPRPNEVLVRLNAVALNHRDLFIRHHQYPAISFDHPLLSDGCGTVVEVGSDVKRSDLLNKSVILTPMRGWESDPLGPEDPQKFAVTGATKLYDVGTAQDYIAVPEGEVELAPSYLSAVESAALPLVGLTGWRALVTKAGISGPGKNVLVTGIGGGVALQVLQFAVAFGSNVYVTSGDRAKIDKAVKMGAKGGVIYKDDDWGNQVRNLLPKDRPYLDAVIDGAGGNVIAQSARILRPGGVVAQYGMTVSPKMDWHMLAVLANIELKGTTMGSSREFRDMVEFVRTHEIRPVVSRTVRGLSNLEAIDGLFADMENGSQFGKLVIEVDDDSNSKL